MAPERPGPDGGPDGAVAPPPLRVAGDGAVRRFDGPFTVGRDEACEVRFEEHARVSRRHLRVFPEDGAWVVEDLGSANGLLVNGERVPRAIVGGPGGAVCDVQVGDGGPHLLLSFDGSLAGTPAGEPTVGSPAEAPADLWPTTPAAPAPAPPAASEAGAGASPPGDGSLSYEDVVKHYFSEDEGDEEAGERTRFIRQAYVDIQKATEKEHRSKQSRYKVLLVASLLVGAIAVGYAGYREMAIRKLRTEAQQLFYQLQTYNVAVAQQVQAVEEEIAAHPESADSLQLRLTDVMAARRQTAARYDQFVRGLGVYDGLSSEEEAIYRVARAFGESELTIPPEFVAEVKTYITRWRNSNRFQTAVRTAQLNGYIPVTVDALRRNGLPTEFFYLAMQESNYDTRIVGPATRYGYAKGAWQFIPETGRRYGLETGPLVAQPVFDPLDERQDFDAAADAAARYLHDIYVHLSQASGLLVCASYNWGEGRVKTNMRGIANDPEHRTYWRFLTEYRARMPDETKGYVMNIFAAAVIGQNPRMFGIDMDPPLAAALAGGGGVAPDRSGTTGPRTRLGGDALQRRRGS